MKFFCKLHQTDAILVGSGKLEMSGPLLILWY